MKPSDAVDVDAGAFEKAIEPIRDAVVRVIDLSEGLRESRGWLPDAASPGMAELAGEQEFSGGDIWGPNPVAEAHNLGQLLLVGAEDLVKSVCHSLTGRVPVFGHIVLTRAALEHAGRAYLLFEPGIGVRLRIARAINERLYSLQEQMKLRFLGEEELARTKSRMVSLISEGERLEFVKAGPFLEESRKTSTDLVDSLLRETESKDRALGEMFYRYFSAVTHGTVFGLLQSVDGQTPTPSGKLGDWRPVGTTQSNVVITLTGLMLGMRKAYNARRELFGWPSPELDQAIEEVLRIGRIAL